MKRSVRYCAVFVFLFVFLSLLLGLSVAAQEEANSYQQARLEDLFKLYNRYRTKEDTLNNSSHATSKLIWYNHMTPMSDLTGEAANDRALIDLIYQRGVASATLSWIYESHPDSHSNTAVSEIYRQKSILILSKTVESDDRISFFEGIGDDPPAVYDCYTLLLNEIYAQQIQELSLPSDSAQVKKILSDAVQRLKFPQTVSPDPNNPTPSFTCPADEDALSYQRYVAYVQEQVAQQRERDVIRNQLDAIYRTLYPQADFSDLSDLIARHTAIHDFLDKLPSAVSIAQMNTLLETTVHALLDELAENQPTYTQQYLKVTLKQQVSEAVALASGSIPSPQTVLLSELCFGETHQMNLAIAQSKDLLIEESMHFSYVSEDLKGLLNLVLTEYINTRFDACQTKQELNAELLRAKLRMEWLALYEEFLSEMNSALVKYSSSVPREDGELLFEKAFAQYTQTDLAIREGARDQALDPLKEDRLSMEIWVRDAEILSYLHKHPVLTSDLSSLTRQDRERLIIAITDSASLSDSAKQEQDFLSLLLDLGSKYQWISKNEVDLLLEMRQENGENFEILYRRLSHSQEELGQAIQSLSCVNEQGELDLVSLMLQADQLVEKASHIQRLAVYYSEQILALSPTYYVDLMHQIFAGAADDIRRSQSSAKESIVTDTIAYLDRLMVLNQLRQTILSDYQQIPSVQALLLQAEERLLPDASDPPSNLTSYHRELVSQIQACIRTEAMDRLDLVYEALMERKEDYSETNLNRLRALYTLAVSEIESHLFSNADPQNLLEQTDSHIVSMRQICLDRLPTSASSEHKGTAKAENGFLPDSTLMISFPSISLQDIARQIHQAARENRIQPMGGITISENLRKSLKRCTVTAALDIQLFHAPSSDNRYNLSILFSESIDLSHVLGIIYICEDGSMEYYEITVRDFLVEFSTSHLSNYYIVSERTVNLMPWIIFLSALLVGEFIVLCLLYLRRRHMRISDTAFAIVMPAPALGLVYRPAGGMTIILVLGIAAVGLGAWIAALLWAERRAAKKQPLTTPALEALVAATVAYLEDRSAASTLPIVAQPMAMMERLPEITAEDAELLMSDEEAKELRQTEYMDEEQYSGSKRAQINLDTIAQYFAEGEIVHLNALKEKRLLPKNVGFVKILARGTLDKPLTILAQDFSTAALKMILLTGGTPVVTHASPQREKKSKRRN